MLLLKEPIFEREKKGTKNVNFLCDFFFSCLLLNFNMGSSNSIGSSNERRRKKDKTCSSESRCVLEKRVDEKCILKGSRNKKTSAAFAKLHSRGLLFSLRSLLVSRSISPPLACLFCNIKRFKRCQCAHKK